ncbi:Urease accessory protein UreH [Bienertia sinuspersici]
MGHRRSLKSFFHAAKIVLFSALAMTIINPARTLPALASLQTATATGGSAVAKGFFRTEILTSAWTGFFAGCLHTLSGPDHLAALAPLSIGRSKMESAAVGALWGCGHDAGQLIFGLLFLLLKDRLHIEVIRTWGTRVVGLTLLVIGAMGIKEASEVPAPCVALENGECDVSVYENVETPIVVKKKKIGFATFATGIVHGLQPDALMMVFLPLHCPRGGWGCIFMHVLNWNGCRNGSEALKDRVPRITEKLTWAASLVAIGLGLAIIISQFFGFVTGYGPAVAVVSESWCLTPI